MKSLVVDFTHTHRPITGIERVSLELFSEHNLPKIDIDYVRAKSNLGMVWAQWVVLPFALLRNRKKWAICPGFPPSVLLSFLRKERILPYIHDLFLLERKDDLNTTAKYYMRPSFSFTVKNSKRFLVNSEYTKSCLLKYCRKDSVIHILRPKVRDIFGLKELSNEKEKIKDSLDLISIGTVEPRKNLRFAVEIQKILAQKTHKKVTLHVVGRSGWGEDAVWLKQQQDVVVHGYSSVDEIRCLLQNSDIFISTSKEEGLGLPLLEVQHGGMFVAASDIPVYQEVLGTSGCLLPLDSAAKSVAIILTHIEKHDWQRCASQKAHLNVEQWNERATADMNIFKEWILK